MSRPDSTPDLRAHHLSPTLVIVGEEDVVTPPSDSELLAAIDRARSLVVLPRTGHLSNSKRRTVFRARLTTFFPSPL